ncbi:hypothetical protein ISN45_Aa01g030970 [Arabidopsis thaliana x Arabidopsis arenosa]|uniref:Uncharacterized protein n=1 Tax=Arabidopsis thaliana x Arabidopsis arenosa TaxID=1240361 RepID=A0A8T2C7S8_9BRAS|nr:hypothetical protein ISN45_Aa01g030970 [Arabidopsis thaliana x Arabidopsis arenosa]
MATLKTTIFIIFVLYISCTLFANIFGVQADASCLTKRECELRCSDDEAQCILGQCQCPHLKVEIEPTKAIRCKTDRDCPDSHQCPKDYYYACLNNGECTCISI